MGSLNTREAEILLTPNGQLQGTVGELLWENYSLAGHLSPFCIALWLNVAEKELVVWIMWDESLTLTNNYT